MINGEKTSICGSNNNIARRMIFPAHGPESVYFHSDSSHDPTVSIISNSNTIKLLKWFTIHYIHSINTT